MLVIPLCKQRTNMATTTWSIDPGHSEIRFKVKHLAIANVSGTFKAFRGNAETTLDNFEKASISFEIDTKSIDTNNAERDNHLRSNLFLDVDIFPMIKFDGVLQKDSGDEYSVEGDLTILKTTKRVTFYVEHTGVGKGRFNDVRAGFELKGKINRKDYGLNFSPVKRRRRFCGR